MSNVSDLWAVQQTDLAVEAIRRRLKEIEGQRGETAEIKTAREAYSAANAELVHWRTTRRDLEIQARELSGKIDAAEKDLMSGRVRNPKGTRRDARQRRVAETTTERCRRSGSRGHAANRAVAG